MKLQIIPKPLDAGSEYSNFDFVSFLSSEIVSFLSMAFLNRLAISLLVCS